MPKAFRMLTPRLLIAVFDVANFAPSDSSKRSNSQLPQQRRWEMMLSSAMFNNEVVLLHGESKTASR